jgi:hypothetical protein
MLAQNSDESFDGTKDGSVNNDRAGKARLKRVLLPGELLLIELVLGVMFTLESRFLFFLLATSRRWLVVFVFG